MRAEEWTPFDPAPPEERWVLISRWALWLCALLTFAAGFMAGGAVVAWLVLQ